jgi:hypothetical protein
MVPLLVRHLRRRGYGFCGSELEELFRTDPSRRNLLSVSSDPRFAKRVRNWDESMRFMIGIVKGERRWEHNLERPQPLLEGPLRHFLEGDPDRPIITGRVYNAEQMPPYTLPANMTQSGLKSRSSKGGGTSNFPAGRWLMSRLGCWLARPRRSRSLNFEVL